MEESILHQLLVTAYAVLFGALAGILFDLLTILRAAVCLSSVQVGGKLDKLSGRDWPLVGRIGQPSRSGRRERFFCFLTDLLFFLLLSPAAVLFLFFFNDGIFRWFFAAGAMAGFAVYRLSMSRAVLFLFRAVLFFLKLFFRYVLHFAAIPFIMIKRKVSSYMKRLLRLGQVFFFRLRKALFLRHRTEAEKRRLATVVRI